MSDSQKPSIRFSGFTNAWEQRRAKDIFVATADKGHSELPVLSATQDRGMIKRDENNINIFHDKKNEEGYKKVVPGQFVIHLRSFQGGFAHSAIEGITSPAYTVFGFQEPEKHDDNYWKYVFTSKEFIRRLETVTYGIRDGRSISYDEFLTMDFFYPDKAEQTQIASYLDEITTLITLHQCKYEKLVNVRKSMLESLFPREGCILPQIRFAEFSGNWGHQRLGEIAEKVIEKNVAMEYTEIFTNSAEFGIISQRDFFDHDIAKQEKIDGYYVVHPEDFVYNPRISVTAPVGPINRNRLGRCGVMSPLYSVFRPRGVDNTFLEYYFKSGHWYPFMRFNGDSGAMSDRFSIKDTIFFEMPIPCPDIEEQRKIGEFLDDLDQLINLHQQKVEKLKNIKTACLQKMFI